MEPMSGGDGESWLARAVFADAAHYWDLEGVQISRCAAADMTAALRQAKLCAESLILSDVGMAAFCETLQLHDAAADDDGEKLGSTPPASLAKIRETVQGYFEAGDVFRYYIANWSEDVHEDAIHYPPDHPQRPSEAGVADGNIFLPQKVLTSCLS
jgi:hypothetical protein